MTTYDDLMAFQRETEALSEISGRLGWDQETVMPRGAADQRSEEIGAIASVLHERSCDPRIGDWLAALPQDLDPVAAAQVRVIRRSFDRATRVPADLNARLARVTSVAQGEWAAARAADDFAGFAPRLAEVVDLKRQEAVALAGDGNLYDALLDDYEPGAKSADLEAMFGALRPGLVDLRARILAAPHQVAALSGTFGEASQLKLSRNLALAFGYNLDKGRIDKAVHPFSSGSGSDVRITTRTDTSDPFNCFYSTIHEVGHGCYEQAVNPDYGLTPIGRGASMGVHESQSRLYENQIGRSRAFSGWLYGQMVDEFGGLNIGNPEDFYASVNRVHDGFIRTEADEVQYNLHVMLRFDLERAMISGDLPVTDLEGAWNDRFLKDFGTKVTRASQGCLQDVHWSVGLFGYFPTYTLGNVYAACIFKALRAEVQAVDQDFARGDTTAATGWLRTNLQRYGSLRLGRNTIEHATGEAPSEAPLLEYLTAKFGDIYRL